MTSLVALDPVATELEKVRLGNVAAPVRRLLVANEPRPEKYVGLEHLRPDFLRISGWTNSSSIIGPGLCFSAGDVLFGRLRPNLRKSAYAHFEGICSPEILVLRPTDGRLAPGFLAVLTQWTSFRDWAIRTATGSKMPRTSWSALARFEFRLPPLTAQVDLWRAIAAFDDAIDAEQAFLRGLHTAREAVAQELLESLSQLDH